MIMFMRSSLAHVGVLLILGLQCLNAVPSDWPAHYPDWWYNGAPSQSVIDIDRLETPGNDALAQQGQVLWMAERGIAELNEKLASVGGAGFSLDELRDSTKTAVYNGPMALGQLKHIASRFYDRFAEVGFNPGDPGWPATLVLDAGSGDAAPNYPWLQNQTPENMSAATLGQAKHLFSWSLDSWGSDPQSQFYSYDALGRLIQLGGNSAATYQYDPEGNLTEIQ